MSFRLVVDYEFLHGDRSEKESLENKLLELEEKGVKKVSVTSLFISRGREFQTLKERVRPFEKRFRSFEIKLPVLGTGKSLRAFAKRFEKEYGEKKKETILLVGHGKKNGKNEDFYKLSKELRKLGFTNLDFIVLKGKGNFKDFERKLVKNGNRFSGKKILLIPIFVKNGNHVSREILGQGEKEKSLAELLETLNIKIKKAEPVLGEQNWFRNYMGID